MDPIFSLRHLPAEVRETILNNAESGVPMSEEQARYFVEKYPDLTAGLRRANDEIDTETHEPGAGESSP